MKKVIVGMLVAVLLFGVSAHANAQVSGPVTQAEVTTQIEALRAELINLLTQMVVALQAQLAAQNDMTDNEPVAEEENLGGEEEEETPAPAPAPSPAEQESDARAEHDLGDSIKASVAAIGDSKHRLVVRYLRPVDSVTYLVRATKNGEPYNGAKVTYPEVGEGRCEAVEGTSLRYCIAETVIEVEAGVEYEVSVGYRHRPVGAPAEALVTRTVKIGSGSQELW